MSDRPFGRSTGPESGDGEGACKAARAFSLRADPRTNTVVKVVLRTGLVVAAVLLLVGLGLQLGTGNHLAIEVKMFDLFAPRPIGERIMSVGVLVLTLTPAGGIVSVVLSWARERDRPYVGVGCVVIAVLAAAVLVGLG